MAKMMRLCAGTCGRTCDDDYEGGDGFEAEAGVVLVLGVQLRRLLPFPLHAHQDLLLLPCSHHHFEEALHLALPAAYMQD